MKLSEAPSATSDSPTNGQTVHDKQHLSGASSATDLEFLCALEDHIAVCGQLIIGVVRGKELVVEEVDGTRQHLAAC